jgi:hypothetical protein
MATSPEGEHTRSAMPDVSRGRSPSGQGGIVLGFRPVGNPVLRPIDRDGRPAAEIPEAVHLENESEAPAPTSTGILLAPIVTPA